MINLNKQVEAIAPVYIPQIHSKAYKYYDTKFFRTTASLEKMYLNKYKRRGSKAILNPFKIVIC